ncbi:hypothetical protein SYNPS1DRAFT_26705 [Syncephalis pseudoplumigaleata]|uniref:Palmitoyltransferase n=1 Tax=Syncephalis pseudoplumigaleata TaxID=1712513 RepID=A0A4P9Z4Y8_9FUNG|nr:hypothetical protein SYNPS1DRAFT_26705 [Syncephalis pseudoplumigaleata]|eukprot:RKP27653.1 hypothetical protein SYNPS1DRAFT_26705 [Syncephalis pseudoplumigaleata]
MSKAEQCLTRAIRLASMFPVVFCLALVSWSYYGFAISLCGHLIRHESVAQGDADEEHGEEEEEEEALVGSHLADGSQWEPVIGASDAELELEHRVIDYREDATVPDTAEDEHGEEEEEEEEDAVLDASMASSSEARVPLMANAAPLNTTAASSTLISSSGSREALASVITVKEDGQPRFCRKCRLNKPDRAHHCRVCGENQKYFYLFIFWGAIYTLFVGVASIEPVYRVLISNNGLLLLNVHWLFVVMCGCIFGLCLTGFAGYHTYLLLTNQTTIETFQSNRYRRLGGTLRHGQRPRLNLFDLGWR